MPDRGPRGLTRIIKATRYSLQGLRQVYRHEQAFRQELLLSAILIPAGIWAGETGFERALLVGVVLLVLIIELINSAVEALTDRIGADLHELSGRAKDAGSAAVFLALLNLCLVWTLVLLW